MSQLATQTFDQQKSELFSERLMEILNNSALSLMISIGHRTGLFDTLAKLPPATSVEIAEAAGLQERYVREWLGAMTTARLVEYDPATRRFVLPPEHAAWLTRAATPQNLAVMMQWIPVLGSVEGRVIESFRNGGGVHYCHYERFNEVMGEDSNQTVVAALLDHIVPLVPGLWQKLDAGIDVLDLGCGIGRAITLLAETFPNSRFSGYDMLADAVAQANDTARLRELTNIRFEARDAANIDEFAQYDLITGFDIVHDQAYPAQVLRQIYRALRPGGTFLMQDIAASSHLENNVDHPIGTLLYTISTMHCMTVSLAQGGEGLGTVWGEELALKMLRDAGFADVRVEKLEHDIQNNYYIMQRPE